MMFFFMSAEYFLPPLKQFSGKSTCLLLWIWEGNETSLGTGCQEVYILKGYINQAKTRLSTPHNFNTAKECQ